MPLHTYVEGSVSNATPDADGRVACTVVIGGEDVALRLPLAYFTFPLRWGRPFHLALDPTVDPPCLRATQAPPPPLSAGDRALIDGLLGNG